MYVRSIVRICIESATSFVDRLGRIATVCAAICDESTLTNIRSVHDSAIMLQAVKIFDMRVHMPDMQCEDTACTADAKDR